jgi:gliding motility-associated-like protein
VVHPVLVHGLPIAAFTFNAPCLGNPTNLNNTSSSAGNDPITSWSWNMTGGVPATSATQTATTTYSAPGTHTVTLTVITQGGCKDTISDTVRVHAPPVANFSGSGTGCLPLCVTNYTDLSLSTDGNIINSTWSFPGGSPSSSTVMNPPKVCYSAAGTYGASLVVTTSFGCIDSIKITPLVSVFAWPHADFCLSPDQAPATDPVFNFCPLWSPNPGVTSWVWDFGDGSPKDSGNSANNLNMTPVHSYSATATANDFYTFNICLKVKNQNGCWDSVCKTVELIPEFEFYISNSFTPNGDGTNDLFFGKGRGIKDYNIWVFDRWGNNIWDCSYSGKNTDWDNTNQDGMPSACKWDGAVVKGGMDMSGGSGQVVQQDVYVWKVKLTDVFDKNHTYVGRVTVAK